MGTVNRVILIGRLGKDPEVRTTAGGVPVSSFSLATETCRGDDGDRTAEWHRVVAFGKVADQCNHYLKKGRLVCIEGSLQTRAWEKPPGGKHYTTEVIAYHVTYLDPRANYPSGQSTPQEEETEPF